MAFVAPVLSLVSGAALVKKLREGKGGVELEAVKKQLRETLEALEEEQAYNSTVASKCQLLEEVNHHLEEQTQDLQQELETTTDSSQHLAEKVVSLTEACSTLQHSADVLGTKNRELEQLLANQSKQLAEQNAKLAAEKLALEEKLVQEQREHAAERQQLLDTVSHLERQQQEQRQQLDAEQREFVRQMEELRQQVSGLLNSFFRDELSEAEVAQKLQALGCEVQLLEGGPPQEGDAAEGQKAAASSSHKPKLQAALPASLMGNPVIDPTWAFQPKLVLDCPERMQRLVAACLSNAVAAAKVTPLQPLPANMRVDRLPSMSASAPKAGPKLTNEPANAPAPTPAPAPAPEPTPKPRAAPYHTPSFTIGHAGSHQVVISAKAGPAPQLHTAPPTPAPAPPTSTFQSLFRSLSMKDARPPAAPPATASLPHVTMARQVDEPAFQAPTMDLARAT